MSMEMREGVQDGIPASQNSREYIDRQREALHLSEKGHEEGSNPHGAPFALFDRLKKTHQKKCEQSGIDENKAPDTISVGDVPAVHFIASLGAPSLIDEII